MTKRKKPPASSEANKYDKIIKENLEDLVLPLLRHIFPIGDVRIENLPQVKLQTTFEREPDFLKIMYSPAYPNGCILHLEFQGKDDKDTDYRMLEYGAMLVRKFKKPIEQHLIYLAPGKPKHTTGRIEFPNLKYHYGVYSLGAISYEEFIAAETPEEVLLAILADPMGLQPEEFIRLIITRLVQLRGNSISISKFIRQLEILSGLRKLQDQTVKIIDTMFIEYDIKKDVRFKQGQAVGLEAGREIGAEEKSIIGIINMTAKGFDIQMIAEVLQVTPDYARQTQSQLQKKNEIISLLEKKQTKPADIANQLGVSILLVEVLNENFR